MLVRCVMAIEMTFVMTVMVIVMVVVIVMVMMIVIVMVTQNSHSAERPQAHCSTCLTIWCQHQPSGCARSA